jgi:hypothetical protein
MTILNLIDVHAIIRRWVLQPVDFIRLDVETLVVHVY